MHQALTRKRFSTQLMVLALALLGLLASFGVQAQESYAQAVCQSYPAGVSRAGCLFANTRMARFAASKPAAPQRVARAMTAVSLQSLLALDTTVRYWNGLGAWAWVRGAHMKAFSVFDSPLAGGGQHPPKILHCPGGGTMGLLNNSGGIESLKRDGHLPLVKIGFEKACRVSTGAPAVTAESPDAQFGTAFHVPDDMKRQLTPSPAYVMFNSQPSLSSMPAWVPEGPLGEVKQTGSSLQIFADTAEENQNSFDFTMWPRAAHAVDHVSYAGVTMGVDPKAVKSGTSKCIAGGRRCFIFSTSLAEPRELHATMNVGGSDKAMGAPMPSPMNLFIIHVRTPKGLIIRGHGAQRQWVSGELVLRSRSIIPTDDGGPQPLWQVVVTPKLDGPTPMLHVEWKRTTGGKTDHGQLDVRQSQMLRLPHYCASGEKSWSCVASDYYPNYDSE